MYKHTSENERLNYAFKQNELFIGYIRELENAYSNTKKIKHDYDNVLLSIFEYVKQKDLESLNKYFQEQVIPFSRQIPKSTFPIELSNLQIPEIKSLFTAKIFEAAAKGLNVHLEISEPITTLAEPLLDFVRILGIFLDNAIESATATEEKQIEIAIIKASKTITFIIKNSTAPLGFPLSKLKEYGFSTKGRKRGTGLSIVDELIYKHPEVLWTTKYENNIFTQLLEIKEGSV